MLRKGSFYYRMQKLGLDHSEPYDEQAFELAFNPRESYQYIAAFLAQTRRLKQTGIESKKDLQVLLDVYELLGVKSPQSLYGAVYDLLNGSE